MSINIHNFDSREKLNDFIKKNKRAVLLKLSKENCPPCVKYTKDLEGYMLNENIDVLCLHYPHFKDMREFTTEYNVTMFPTTILLNAAGNVVDKKVGYSNILDLDSFIHKHINLFK